MLDLIKALVFIVPFFINLIFGPKSGRKRLKNQRLPRLMVAAFLISASLNCWLFYRSYLLGLRYVDARTSVVFLQEKNAQLQKRLDAAVLNQSRPVDRSSKVCAPIYIVKRPAIKPAHKDSSRQRVLDNLQPKP